jgi:D-tyrosyl-tRNA(Tyr) deacylase
LRAVVQRVSSARVTVAGETTGEISTGLLVLLGVAQDDTGDDAQWLADKVCALRIFEDDEGRMNRSVVDIAGGVLVVSQFTLLADFSKGNRPSFNGAAKPEVAKPLFELFVQELVRLLGQPVPTGVFGADMRVELVNDGPVTVTLE